MYWITVETIQANQLKPGDVIPPYGPIRRVIPNNWGVDVVFRTGRCSTYYGLVDIRERQTLTARTGAPVDEDMPRSLQR